MNRIKTLPWYLAAVLGLLTVLSTIYGVCAHYSPVPFWDQWDGEIDVYLRALQYPISALFEQHNEHRLAISHLLFFADLRYFGGRNVSLLIENLMLAGLLALTMYRVAIRQADARTYQRVGLAGAVLMVAFSWMQSENFTWAFQSQWFAVYLFALCAFHATDLSADAWRRRDGRRTNLWLIAALISATLAAYSMSSGVFTFPVVILLAWYHRLGLARLIAIGMTTALVWLAYFVNWHAPGGSGTLHEAMHNAANVLTYFLYYLGAPAHHAKFANTAVLACGLASIAILVLQVGRLLSKHAQTAKATALLAFTVFVAGNALLTAYGRYEGGLSTAFSLRYATASLNGWLALIVYTYLNANMAWSRRITLTAAVALLLLLIPVQRHALTDDVQDVYENNVAGLALRAHVYDSQFTQATFPSVSAITQIARKAEAAHISIFSPSQPNFLVAPAKIDANRQCQGNIDQIATTATPGVLVARGWIYDPASRSVPHSIVLTDTAGNTLGTGIAGGIRDDVKQLYGRHARYSQWTAFFSATNGQVIVANGKTARGRFCSIAARKSALPSS